MLKVATIISWLGGISVYEIHRNPRWKLRYFRHGKASVCRLGGKCPSEKGSEENKVVAKK